MRNTHNNQNLFVSVNFVPLARFYKVFFSLYFRMATRSKMMMIVRWKKDCYGNNVTNFFLDGKSVTSFLQKITFIASKKPLLASPKWEDSFSRYVNFYRIIDLLLKKDCQTRFVHWPSLLIQCNDEEPSPIFIYCQRHQNESLSYKAQGLDHQSVSWIANLHTGSIISSGTLYFVDLESADGRIIHA